MNNNSIINGEWYLAKCWCIEQPTTLQLREWQLDSLVFISYVVTVAIQMNE